MGKTDERSGVRVIHGVRGGDGILGRGEDPGEDLGGEDLGGKKYEGHRDIETLGRAFPWGGFTPISQPRTPGQHQGGKRNDQPLSLLGRGIQGEVCPTEMPLNEEP